MKKIRSTYLNTIIFIVISLTLFCFYNLMSYKPQNVLMAKAVNIEIEDDSFYEYLLELSNNDLNENSFVNITSLSLDSSTILNNEITIISGLNQFNWDSLESIVIQNLYNLTSINLNYENFDDIFPSLKTIIIERNHKLEHLNLGTSSNIINFELTNNPSIEQLYLPDLQNCETIKLSQLNGENCELSLSGIFSSLKSIEISDSTCVKSLNFTNPTNLKSISILNSSLININIQNAPNLENVTATNLLALENVVIVNANNLSNLTFDEQDDSIEIASPKLKTFTIKNNLFISKIKIQNSTTLNTINLENCSETTELYLPENLDSLIELNLHNLINVNTNFSLLNCHNLEILNLYNCKLLTDVFFEQIDSLNNLHYLNLEKTSISNIRLTNKPYLKNLYLGNYYALESIYLDNIPTVTELLIKNCEILKKLYINELSSLENIDFYNVSNLEKINIHNTKISELYIYSYDKLNILNLSNNTALKTISVQLCANLKDFNCAESLNVETLMLVRCPILKATVTKQFENLSKLQFFSIEYCDFLEDIRLKDCNKMNFLDLTGLNNLQNISLKNIGTENANFSLILPSEFKKLKTLELVNLPTASLSNPELICNNGLVSKLILDNIPIKKIDFSNNEIISITLKNLAILERVNLANNNITQFDKLINELEAMKKLIYANINGNKIDFTNEETLQLYTKSVKREKIVIGLQNIINNNKYSYNPTIFIGNFDSNIRLNIYHSSSVETSLDTQYIDTNAYHLVEYNNLSNITLDGGTYIFKFTKFNGSEFVNIQEGDVSYYNYLPQYCAVLKNAPWYSNLWFILLVIASGILIYVTVSYIYITLKTRKEKKKKKKDNKNTEGIDEEYYDDDDEEDEGYSGASKKLKNNMFKSDKETLNTTESNSPNKENNNKDDDKKSEKTISIPEKNLSQQTNYQIKKDETPKPKIPNNKKPPLPKK